MTLPGASALANLVVCSKQKWRLAARKISQSDAPVPSRQFGAEFDTREDSEVRGRKFLQANYAINIDLVVVGNRDSDYAVSLEPIDNHLIGDRPVSVVIRRWGVKMEIPLSPELTQPVDCSFDSPSRCLDSEPSSVGSLYLSVN